MSRLPFPAVSGRKNSLFHYCKILSEELGYYLIVAAFLECEDKLLNIPKFIDKLIVLPNPSGARKIINLVWKSFLTHRLPIQASLYWNPKADVMINEILSKEKPEICIADMVRTTEYLRKKTGYRIADLDDMISLRYERQLESDFDEINPYGAYINAIPKVIQRILVSKMIKHYIVKKEIRLLGKYELQVAREFERTILVAQRECDIINEKLMENKAAAVPIGVDYTFFSSKIEQYTENNYICFLGQMNVAHNETAVIYFIENVLPILKERNPNLVFWIIGGGVTDKLKKYETSYIIFTGYVEDIRIYLQKSKVFVCPLQFGSGIKTKVLEAMASGIPVVTTTIGAENIGAEDGRHWFVENQPNRMAERIESLLNNEVLNHKIGISGQAFIKENWTWDKAKSAFSEILGESQN